MIQNELNKIIKEQNASTKYHTINLENLIPKLEKSQKNTNNKFYVNKKVKKIGLSKKTTLNNEKIRIKQNTTSLIHNPNNNYITNISIIKDSNLSNSKIKDKNNNKPLKKNDFSSIIEIKVKTQKDPVIAFFNRNFYSCEVPISKKILDNQKILDYYIKDKENKEKYKQLLKARRYYSINKNNIRIVEFKKNSYKRNDIKQSLMLNDFRLYNRIHQVVRFWNKFINYACPIFQLQKFSLNSQKYKIENNNISSSMDKSNKSYFNDKNIKLPKLYTNSSKFFKYGENNENKFLRRNKSTII